MISSIYLTGEAGPFINKNCRYLRVTRPVPDYASRNYVVDSFLVVIKNPPGTSSQFSKVPEGTLVIVKGRLECCKEANELIQSQGLLASALVVIAELTECYTLSENMKGYQEFFPFEKEEEDGDSKK